MIKNHSTGKFWFNMDTEILKNILYDMI
jgi:hypothetical protein